MWVAATRKRNPLPPLPLPRRNDPQVESLAAKGAKEAKQVTS
jgi:hypothetical protein